MRKAICVLLVLIVAAIQGCTTYAKITDPETGKVYYTRGNPPARSGYSGTLTFTDAKTGAQVNLDSSEVYNMSKEEFESIVGPIEGTYNNSWRFGN